MWFQSSFRPADPRTNQPTRIFPNPTRWTGNSTEGTHTTSNFATGTIFLSVDFSSTSSPPVPVDNKHNANHLIQTTVSLQCDIQPHLTRPVANYRALAIDVPEPEQ
ncbi:hypothetical protein NUW54_g11409 [Trametes sanguinea]|uniref:Uncharacterized protein n=1 Tax=Trametes sanguinea TaxID=158606 RepID=A0ACC1NEW5_9APHY|nr:hypothetical protein NUW54_g11409 [Trametes sanguinea]